MASAATSHHITSNVKPAHSFSSASNATAASLVFPKSSPQAKRPGVPLREIFRRLVLLSDGRDKTLKIIQYSAKLYLWVFLSPKSILAKYRTHPSSSTLQPRLTALTSHFSTTRKILRLAHFLEPYSDFRGYINGTSVYPDSPSDRAIYYIGLVNSIVGMLNDIFDDLYCLGNIGVLSKAVEKRAEPFAIRLWFVNILLDISDCLIRIRLINLKMNEAKGKRTEEDLKVLKNKRYWQTYSLIKLLADLGFCGYDFFEFDFSKGWQPVTGLIAGVLSFYKLWLKCAVAAEAQNSIS